MSELKRRHNRELGHRSLLLATVSGLAIVASLSPHTANAADQSIDHSTVWIELGGQLERVTGQGQPFSPGFVAANPNSPVLTPVSPIQAQNPAPFGFAEQGKILIQPQGADWIFSASIRYGRSNNNKHVDHQTNRTGHQYNFSTVITTADENFADTQVRQKQSHAVLDFSAGKEVGLGMFGHQASSVVSLGVRFAQFASAATFDVRARPDLRTHEVTFPYHRLPFKYFHTYHASGHDSRSFRGVGPSVSWNGSAPLVGNSQGPEILFDWGANAAALFGRQKSQVQHHESAHYVSKIATRYRYFSVYDHPLAGHSSDRSIVVPNVGGFAGISVRDAAAKISFGYRADFFFGAIDGGIDARRSETLGFFGPFANVSVGLGG